MIVKQVYNSKTCYVSELDEGDAFTTKDDEALYVKVRNVDNHCIVVRFDTPMQRAETRELFRDVVAYKKELFRVEYKEATT